jgi:hypothetical protein
LNGTTNDTTDTPPPREFGTGPNFGPGVSGLVGDQGLLLNDDFGFDITNGPATHDDFTLSCWMRIDVPQDVCCGGSAYWMGTALFQGEVGGVVADSGLSIAGGSGTLAAFGIGDPGVADTTILGTTELDDGRWHLVTATREIDGGVSNLNIYLDGQLEASGTSPYVGPSNANSVWEVGLGQTRGLAGNMDDVRVYGVALSQGEIEELFEEQVPLVRHYPLDGAVEDAVTGETAAVSGTGAPVYTQGVMPGDTDQAFQLDNDYGIDVPNEAPNDFTLSCWVRMDGAQFACCGGGAWWTGTALFQGEIAGAHNNSGLTIAGAEMARRAAFGTGNPMTTIFSTTELDDGEWHLVTGTREIDSDASVANLSLYIDGQLEATGMSSNIGPLDTNGVWGVGRQGQNRGLVGDLDDVRVYRVALGAADVEVLYIDTRPPPLVRYYPVDGDVNDVVTGEPPLAVSGDGTPVYVPGVTGEPDDLAFRLDNDYGIDVPNEVPNNFTLSCWIRMDGPQFACCGGGAWWTGTALFQGEIAGAHNNSGLTIAGSDGDSNQAAFGTGNPMTTIFSTTALDDGQWHMVTGTRFINTDSGTAELKLYIDGQLEAMGTSANVGALDTNDRWGVGRQGQNRGFVGDMDEIRVYDTALSAGAVEALFESTSVPEVVIPLARRYTMDGTVDDAVTGEGPLAVSGTGTPIYTCGILGQAFRLDNDYGIDVPNDAPNDFTLSCWVRMDGAQFACCGGGAWWTGTALFQGEIAGAHNNSGLTIAGAEMARQAAFGTGNPMTTIFSTTELDDGEWHLVTGTREIDDVNGVANLSLYIDGRLEATGTSSNIGPLDTNDRWGVGRQGQNRGLVGDMDDARVYRVALAATEIEELFSEGKPLTRHYPVDGDPNDAVTGEGPLAVSGTGTPVYTGGATDNPGDQAFELDNDYGIDVPNEVPNDFTLSCWVRMDGAQFACCGGGAWWTGTALFQGEIAGAHNNSGLTIAGAEMARLAAFGTGNPMTTIFSMTELDDGEWHMVTGSRRVDIDAGVADLSLYIDGQLEATGTSPNIGPLDTNDRWGVGRQGQNRGLVGDMDDIRVYGKALSDGEVNDLFNSSRPFVSHYPFDGTLDDVQGGFHGTLTGAGGPNFVAGITPDAGDQALFLQDDYGVDVPNNVPNDFTLSCWVLVDEPQDLCCGGSAFWMGTSLFQGEVAGNVDDSGLTILSEVAAFGIGNPDTTIIGTMPLTDGEWHLVTATRSINCETGVSDLVLYVDGQVDASGTAPNTGSLTANSIWGIGTGQTRGLIGLLDEARIYARALSSEEVQALFDSRPTEDVEPPTINCPDNVTVVEACVDGEITVEYDAPTATDNVDAPEDITIVCDLPSGSTFAHGDTLVECTATDSSGNTSSCTFTVTVDCGGRQQACDFNQDGNLDISDAVALLDHLFLGGSPPPCGDNTIEHPANVALLDANGDGNADLSDAVHKLNFLFLGGPGPIQGDACIFVPDCPDNCES